MPPHLHPRSKLTSSLFATTLLASFLVVGVPHLIPCPAPRVAYADGEIITLPDGTQRRRRRRYIEDGEGKDLNQQRGRKEVVDLGAVNMDGTLESLDGKKGRECPIPKPSGMVGELLGFRKDEVARRIEGTDKVRPP